VAKRFLPAHYSQANIEHKLAKFGDHDYSGDSMLPKESPMKKLVVASVTALLVALSVSVFACPKGQHPYGGEGPHHKGGYCGP